MLFAAAGSSWDAGFQAARASSRGRHRFTAATPANGYRSGRCSTPARRGWNAPADSTPGRREETLAVIRADEH
jgi:hypothetical protein